MSLQREMRAKESGSAVLLIQTDGAEATGVTEVLKSGFQVRSCPSLLNGLAQAMQQGFAAVVLDLRLADFDPTEAIHQIRRRSNAGLLAIASEASEGVAALEAGADDFVVAGQYELLELTARLRAVLRRTQQQPVAVTDLTIGQLRINSLMRSVVYKDQPVQLTSMEFDLLELLTRSAGRVVSRDEITTILNQRTATPFERAIDVHISRLRKKLRANLIRSIRGVGYLLQPPAQGSTSENLSLESPDAFGQRPATAFETTGFRQPVQLTSPAA
jgi:DNA-binding response OmpR family regulator